MKKDKTILLRVSANEKQKLTVLAKGRGMAVSEYLLNKAFEGITPKAAITSEKPADDLPNAAVRKFMAWRHINCGY